MDIVKNLPNELQNKVFYCSAKHPCAEIIHKWVERCWGRWAHYEYKTNWYESEEAMREEFVDRGFYDERRGFYDKSLPIPVGTKTGRCNRCRKNGRRLQTYSMPYDCGYEITKCKACWDKTTW